MENDDNKKFESIYSEKVRAGRRRTYFFDVRKTKGEDFYITLTESTKRFDGDGYDRHKIFLYKEDFNRFVNGLNQVVDHVKTDLMPDYDYEQFERRQEEWEKQKKLEAEAEARGETIPKPEGDSPTATAEVTEAKTEDVADATETTPDAATGETAAPEDDMAW